MTKEADRVKIMPRKRRFKGIVRLKLRLKLYWSRFDTDARDNLPAGTPAYSHTPAHPIPPPSPIFYVAWTFGLVVVDDDDSDSDNDDSNFI